MKKWIVLLSISLFAFLGGCGDENEKIKASQEDIIEKRFKEWEVFKNQSGGSYNMTYLLINDQGEFDKKELSLLVSKNVLDTSSSGNITIDRMFDDLFILLDDRDCTLQFELSETQPIIQSYMADCKGVFSGMEITDFKPILSEDESL